MKLGKDPLQVTAPQHHKVIKLNTAKRVPGLIGSEKKHCLCLKTAIKDTKLGIFPRSHIDPKTKRR